jgi:hypothetical protein
MDERVHYCTYCSQYLHLLAFMLFFLWGYRGFDGELMHAGFVHWSCDFANNRRKELASLSFQRRFILYLSASANHL